MYEIIKSNKIYLKQISKIMLSDLAKPDKRFSKEIIDKYKEHAQENNLIKEFENPNLISFLAVADNKVLDFIVGYKRESNTCYIDYISGNNLEVKRDLIRRFIEECKEEIISDGLAYSLILHLRSAYIVDCLINRREWPTKGILFLIKNIAGSLKSYDGYLRVKNNLSLKSEVPVEEARRLLEYTLIKVEEHKKWAQKRK